MTRKIYTQILFLIMGLHSFVSAFILPPDMRNLTFLGMADFYFLLFLLLNAKQNSVTTHGADNRLLPAIGFLLVFSLIVLLAFVSYVRFGAFYAIVELRPYIGSMLIILMFSALGLRVSLNWILEVFTLFCLIEVIFIITNLILGTHKVGLFGEMNYDVQFFVVGAALAGRSLTFWHVIYGIIAKTKTFLAYTLSLWVLRNPILIATVGLLALGIFSSGMVPTFEDVADNLDRLYIAGVMLEVVTERYKGILTCGQLFCGELFYEPALWWYIDTQALSSSLNSVVPAVFHGHLLRNIFLLGLPATIILYSLVLARMMRRKGAWVIIGWITLSSISQSIFHHPFVGLALIFSILYLFQSDLDGQQN